MANGAQDVIIEAFVTDAAFTDQTSNVANVFPTTVANAGELNSNALSFFAVPNTIVDRRVATSRDVNWAATTRPKIVIDDATFPAFVANIKTLTTPQLSSFFNIVDQLLFNYNPANNRAAVEASLLNNPAIGEIYVPDSFSISTSIVADHIYNDGEAAQLIAVPAYAKFEVKLPTGLTTQNFVVKIYAGIESFLNTYSQSTITEVIPPLPYNQLFNASLATASDNIFATASITATLSYNTVQARLRNNFVSGMVEFKVVLKDQTNSVPVPFNILYQGREPTLFEIRNAIKDKLLSSGIGDAVTWKKRIPGVFVSGRFYVVPFWDQTYQKPDQSIFPNIMNFGVMQQRVEDVLATLGYSDVTEYMDIVPAYYNHMTVAAIPDLSGAVDVVRLKDVVPDYQSFSVTDEQFAYMLETTKTFAKELNVVLSLNPLALQDSVYGPNKEGILEFYSYTAGNYEVCVITKLCYQTVLGSEL